MNPTREQFELAARAAGVCLHPEDSLVRSYGNWGCSTRCSICGKDTDGFRWNPHLPGTDNAMLAAALKIYMGWYEDRSATALATSYMREIAFDAFPGTETERRARAMAFAVFLVAVEIGRTMKENQDAR